MECPRNDTIKNNGIVSRAVAEEMAQGAISQSDAQVAISVTGCAGPGMDSEGNQPGDICFCFVIKDKVLISEKVKIEGENRNDTRKKAVIYAFSRMIELLKI